MVLDHLLVDVVLAYRGRQVTAEDVAFIAQLIREHPEASRRGLSKKLCVAWDWYQPNGTPRDMVCRGLMLALHRAGHIELPPVRQRPPNPLAVRARTATVAVDETPVHGLLSELQPLEFCQVRRTAEERIFNSLIEKHHYLGYVQPVGEHLKFMVYARGRPLSCLAWQSAPRHLGPRDRFIGWSATARRRNVHLLAYNPRYLIMPWVKVPHLASHILGRMARLLPDAWQYVYGHRVVYLETFVDPDRYRGTCYLAANWKVLGETTGRGKDSRTRAPNRSIKQVLGYPLDRRFRRILATVD